MAVSTTALAIRYAGNGSTSTAYTIPFPFLDTSHIYAAVSSDGVEAPVLLELSDYTVTRLANGSGGSLKTTEAVTSPAEIVIFRSLPLTQPAVFQPAGPFPAKVNEKALDRLLMQVQQLNRRLNELEGVEDEDYIYLPGSNPGITQTVKIWEDSTERGTTTPTAVGQIGVETETQTVWIAQSTAVGDWVEFRPQYEDKLLIGFVSDAGGPSSYATGAVSIWNSRNVDAVIFGGDNNAHGAAGYDSDWAPFASYITAGKAYPALGNLDLDTEGWETLHAAKFSYLPGNKRYYTVILGGGLVQLFVLNSGYNSTFELQEPDGNAVGSVQHTWFVEQLAVSTARWKIALFHHPPVTMGTAENQIAEAMAWPELSQMHMICCGHTHMTELLKWNDTMVVNMSALVSVDGTAGATMQGVVGLQMMDWPLWVDDETQAFGVISAAQDRLGIELLRASPYPPHARPYNSFTPQPILIERFEVIEPDVAIGLLEDKYAGTLPAASKILQVAVAAAEGGVSTDCLWTLKAGDDTVATGTLLAGATFMKKTSLLLSTVVPSGTRLTVSTGGEADAKGLEVLLYVQRLN